MVHSNDLLLRSKGLAVIAIPLVPLLVIAIWLIVNVRQERQAQGRVAHTLEVRAQIASVLGLLVEQEAAVRGFLLTGSADALAPYVHSRVRWPDEYARLGALVSDNPAQVERVDAVGRLAAARPLPAILDYARAHPGGSAPLDLLARSRGTMSELRALLTEIERSEDRLSGEWRAAANRAQDRLVRVAVGGALLGVLGGTVAATAFAAGVARRLDLVRENADRLAHNEPMTRAMSGTDEVAQLAERLGEAGVRMAQQSAEAEAARQELDRFFSLSLDLLCIADMEGRFMRVNPAWRDALGWSPEDLTLVPYATFIHPHDVAATIAESAQLADGKTTVNFENRYRAKDGSYRWLNWKAIGVPERGVIYAAARDVTEQKATAGELRERVADLGALNQELEAFSYSVSHDLRAPLRHITGFASLLQQHARESLDPVSQRYLRTIAESATRMGRLIDDLLSFSRMGRATLVTREVDLDDLVRDARRDATATADGRTISWAVEQLPTVRADPSMLRLVLNNLLSNAIKYTRTRERAEIEIGSRPGENGETVIFVRDNGVGFDPRYTHKLFGVFQRLHGADEFEGTGIGLANVRRIIDRHGGRTWAEGALGRGATFYFTLPHADVPSEVPA